MFSASAVGKGRGEERDREEGGREGNTAASKETLFFSVSFCFHFSFTYCRRQNPTAPFRWVFPFLHSGPAVLASLRVLGFFFSSLHPEEKLGVIPSLLKLLVC
jgi:hypothetical protein